MDLVASSGDVTELTLHPCAKHVGELQWLAGKHKNVNGPIENQCLVCSFWATLEQQGGLPGRGLALYVDINSSFKGTKNTVILIVR